MNAYIIEFLDATTGKVITETVSRYTFAEAASWAYMRRLDCGYEWKIDAIKKHNITDI